MRFIFLIYLLFIFSPLCVSCTEIVESVEKGEWITIKDFEAGEQNLWLSFVKKFERSDIDENIILHIAADTKYWLWLNDTLLIREGGLKWGPAPSQYYYDMVEIDRELLKEQNNLSIAVWHFGKDGFSHYSSKYAALKINATEAILSTDSTWQGRRLDCFESKSEPPHPNWRLSESNIHFINKSQNKAYDSEDRLFGCFGDLGSVQVIKLSDFEGIERPIGQWKNYGRKQYVEGPIDKLISKGDTLTFQLPYNMQVTPYFKIKASAGKKIDIRTDNYQGGSAFNVRTNYETLSGLQIFETPGWMNGHFVHYYFPEGVEIIEVGYRESGYATEFSGQFQCDDAFLNVLWKKSARTLYITMRDNFMDCPDRERAQWWGDAVIQSGQCSYAFDRESDRLTKKAIRELMNWQREDSTIYSPIPAGNWDQELPTQMLASVGYYGFWNYYLHTGDLETIKEVYPKVRDYLDLWTLNDKGLVDQRKGGWTWGDWGDNKDMPLIYDGWYNLALKGQALMAKAIGLQEEANELEEKRRKHAEAFNSEYWNGQAYRSANYEGETDERGHALAILSDIAPDTIHAKVKDIIQSGFHCSPYFEKYVYEALIKLGEVDSVLERMRLRYSKMVESPITTLWEGWEVGSATWGGGTYNHSWSGGPLTIMSQYIAGVTPLEPGYQTVLIHPRMGNLKQVLCEVDTPMGLLKVEAKMVDGKLEVDYDAPEGMQVKVVGL